MTTPRVGVDLVAVDSIANSIAHFGERYLRRVYTERELADCDGEPQRLAARFAAKEATLKVLRPPQHWFDWRQIETRRADGGWVELELHGAARSKAAQEGLGSFSVSLSHERGHAIAVVIATASVHTS